MTSETPQGMLFRIDRSLPWWQSANPCKIGAMGSNSIRSTETSMGSCRLWLMNRIVWHCMHGGTCWRTLQRGQWSGRRSRGHKATSPGSDTECVLNAIPDFYSMWQFFSVYSLQIRKSMPHTFYGIAETALSSVLFTSPDLPN